MASPVAEEPIDDREEALRVLDQPCTCDWCKSSEGFFYSAHDMADVWRIGWEQGATYASKQPALAGARVALSGKPQPR